MSIPTMTEQFDILRTRIRNFEERVAELEAQPGRLSHADSWLLFSLQAQVQADRALLRDTTGEL